MTSTSAETAATRPEALRLNRVSRTYGRGPGAVHALRDVTLSVAAGEFLAVLGRSGSGKSTLMNLLAGLDRPDSGEILVGGASLGAMSGPDLARYRSRTVGIVFQSFHLLSGRTAMDQVSLPLLLDGVAPAERERRAEEALASVGLADRAYHTPGQLSGGEQQRVAVARAIVRRPKILLCDEPTGNLDSANAVGVVDLISGLRRTHDCTVVMITHEADLAERAASRVVRMRDGALLPAAGEGREGNAA